MTETMVMQKLEVALVGTKWGLEQYLVESLEEDPWKFLVRVVKEGLAELGLFRCCECGAWTHDLLPGANVCRKCAGRKEVVGQEHAHELEVALKSGALHPDFLLFDPDLLPDASHTQTPTLAFPDDESISGALAGIDREADPNTATIVWDDRKAFANWAVDRLLTALRVEIKGEQPCES